MRPTRPFRTLLAVAALLTLPAAGALADGFVVISRRVPDQPHIRNIPLAVKYHRVTVTVNGRVAVTEVDQVFVNPNPRRVEGHYLFPLPKGATIDRFSMWVDGKELSAELLDAAKARDIYEGIVRRQRDPALLEYAEQGLFKARIYPIEPHSEKRVRIRYAEVLSADNGTVSYRYPLNTEKFSSRPLQDVSVRVTIDGDGPVRSVYSPSHRIDVPKDLSGAVTVGWEDRNVTPDRDFLLYWRPTSKRIGVSLVAHRDPTAQEDGTFLLVLSPGIPDGDKKAKALPKDVVFVMDTSGSMAGKPMEQAMAALRYCLRSLNSEDRFALLPFATEPRAFRDALVTATKDNVAAAERFVDGLEARGGTAIHDALMTTLRMLKTTRGSETTRPAYVLFLTDGMPTIGVTDVETILRDVAGAAGARVFAFGVGNKVNTKLLDRLAEDNRGTRTYVAQTESIEEKVSNLFAKIAHPAMSDLTLSIEGAGVTAVHPRKLGDLFHGSEVLVTGRYKTPGQVVIRLKGKVRGREVVVVEEVKLPEKTAGHEFLPRLWAVRRVGFLLDQLRIHGESGEVKDEVVKLAKKFGIITPYTSYLIVEDEGRSTSWPGTADARPRRRGQVPLFDSDFGSGSPGGGGERPTAGGGRDQPEADPSSSPAPTAEEQDLLEHFRKAAGKAQDAADAESGEGAVGLSRSNADLRGFAGDKDTHTFGRREKAGGKNTGLVRHLSGRTFVTRGGIWWDLDVDLRKERRVIEAFGADYFALVRAHPKLGPYLKLGRVVLVVGDQVVEIRDTP